MDSLGVRNPVKLSIRSSARTISLLFAFVLLLPAGIHAQRGGRGAPSTPRQAAPTDLTGYWVSVITEDWKLRRGIPSPNGNSRREHEETHKRGAEVLKS